MNHDKLNETRPFDVAAAKAGAPYCCCNGDDAMVSKFDGRSPGAELVGYFGPYDTATAWCKSGRHFGDDNFSLVMTPLGYIDGKPVFWDSEVQTRCSGVLKACHLNGLPLTYCSWPEAVKQYPVSGMSNDELMNLCRQGTSWYEDARCIANAALRHAIDSGQVVVFPTDADRDCNLYSADGRELTTPSGMKFYNGSCHAARDMAIAKAVRDLCEGITENKQWQSLIRSFDLASIIAGVRP